MKYLITISFILLTLGTFPNIAEDNNIYSAELPEITVTALILEGYKPKKTKTELEFIKHNKPLFLYVAKYTWLTEAQVFSFLRIEQGNSSEIFTKHNNAFNIKGKGVKYVTWEYRKTNKQLASFKSYKTIQEGLEDFITLINTKYYSKNLSNLEHAKYLYNKGYFTDPNWRIRSILANKYEKMNV